MDERINPTEETPVETSEFLSHLNLVFLDLVLKKMSSRLERIREEVYARVCKSEICCFSNHHAFLLQ